MKPESYLINCLNKDEEENKNLLIKNLLNTKKKTYNEINNKHFNNIFNEIVLLENKSEKYNYNFNLIIKDYIDNYNIILNLE